MGARAGGVGDRGDLVMRVADALGRPLRSLRVSVTDRCNLRCGYCMPEEEYAWLPRDQILHFEEMSGLVDVFLDLGVDKVRLTGGEPLLRRNPAELRFIEYMDVGGATRWSMDQVVSRAEILEVLAFRYGTIEPLVEPGSTAPAERFRLSDGTTFGIIASTTAPFCRSCDRSRLTADGMWYLCLYAVAGVDLRGPLRRGATREELAALITGGWRGRADRGAEERLVARDRGPLMQIGQLKRDPHLEMHTRGG